jgi:hypothetical protein
MFLFTTNTAASATPQETVRRTPFAGELKRAADRSGVSFDYLARTAERESRFDPQAKAPTSSATGLFQFLDQTWLGMVRSEGPKLGLKAEAEAIGAAGGRFSVVDPAMRDRILKLRENPAVAAEMAGAFARRNGDSLRQATGREPTAGELYMAHFLGAAGARELIALSASQPSTAAAERFPEAAAANRSVFFDAAGRARSVAEVSRRLSEGFAEGPATAVPARGDRAGEPAAVPFFRDSGTGKRGPLTGLFRDDGAPVARAISDTWSRLGQRAAAPAPAGPRLAFFPKAHTPAATGTLSDAAPDLPALSRAEPPVAVTVSLPPARPAAPELLQRDVRGPRPGKPANLRQQPLDLLAFMTRKATP